MLRAKNEHRELLEARIVRVNTVDFFILLIPTPLVSALFCSSIPSFIHFLNVFLFLVYFVEVCRLLLGFVNKSTPQNIV